MTYLSLLTDQAAALENIQQNCNENRTLISNIQTQAQQRTQDTRGVYRANQGKCQSKRVSL